MIKFVQKICVSAVLACLSLGAFAGELTVQNVQEVRTVDLTSEGSADWLHVGLTSATSLNRKDIPSALLSFTTLGNAPGRFGSNGTVRSTLLWSDGTPVASEAGFSGGWYYPVVGDAYQITAPADQSTRTATIHLGGWNSTSQVSISLSDGSATPVTLNMSNAAVYHHTVTITYSADSPSQQLVVTHTYQSGPGNIIVQGATLLGAAVNQAPTFTPVPDQTVTESTTLDLDIQAADPDGPVQLIMNLESSVPALPVGAVFTDLGNGSANLTWTPLPSEIGNYTVTFRATDDSGAGLFTDEVVLIQVVANQAPILSPIGNQSTVAGNTMSFSVSASDADGPAPLVLSIASSTPSLPLDASFIDNGNGSGSFSWPTDAGDIGTYDVTFRAREDGGSGAFTEETVELTVSSVPTGSLSASAPAVAPYTNNLTTQGTLDWMHFGLSSASTVNRKSGVTPLLTQVTTVGGVNRFGNGPSLRPTHTWSDGTPTASVGGFSGGIYITGTGASYEITAPASGTGELRTLIVHLGGYGGAAQIDVRLSDDSAPPFSTSISGSGVYHHELQVVYAASSAAVDVEVTLTKTSAGGNIILQSASLAGPPENQPPAFTPIADQQVSESNELALLVNATDVDGPGPLVLSVQNSTPALPPEFSFIDNGNGSADINWTPEPGDAGTYTVTLRAQEDGGSGLFTDEEFDITVLANQAPTLDAIGNQSVGYGSNLSFSLSAQDADGPAPIAMTIHSASPALPPEVSFIDNGNGTADFAWTPGSSDQGTYTIEFRATQSGSNPLFATETIQLTVTEPSVGALNASIPSTSPYLNNLTTEGTLDWMHWGLSTATTINRKASGGNQLGYSILQGAPHRFGANNSLRPQHAWTDGTPTGSNGGFSGGIFFNATNEGFEITAPADTSTRTLVVHLGGYNSTGDVQVTLSDGSASAFSTTISGSAAYQNTLTVVYSAGSAGQQVSVQYRRVSSGGNITLQAATLSGPPPALLPYNETFDNSSALSSWSVVDEAGITSNWAVSGGELLQNNGVESVTARDGTYQLGTHIHWTQGFALNDYHLAVTAQFNGSDLAEDLGVVFRYQDVNNYYRLALSSRYGYTRLEKRVAGQFSTLAVNSRGYKNNEAQLLEVRVVGSTIIVLVNSDVVFAVEDTSLASGTVGLFAKSPTRFDDFSLIDAPTTGLIGITSPIAYLPQSSSTLQVSALALNVPSGGNVQFVLNDNFGSAVVDSTAPFQATFAGVAPGEHKIDAILRNSSNVEVARATNNVVGTSGDFVVGIGDSITNGIGDFYLSDNTSAQESIIGFQGYEATLTDHLNNTRGFIPTIVFNEGIGGDETFDAAFDRADSILERHPNIDTVLIGLGTNDTFVPVLSGLGCSGSGCNGTYKGNLQTLVDKIRFVDYPTNTVSSGIEVWVARTPPAFTGGNPWSSSANDRIRDYNTVIETEINGINIGPDLFDFFMPNSSDLRTDLFSDTLHPNGLGYLLMATLWHNAIESASPLQIPFAAQNVASASSDGPVQDLIEVGDEIRLNQTDVVTSIPGALANGRWIKTNDDVNNTSASYISFDVDRNVEVYIAYDGGASARPNWMSGYVDTGLTITTTDPNAPTMNLYSQSFSAGTVTLGGNSATGESGSNANYVTIIVEI